jgi:hypothetical protein
MASKYRKLPVGFKKAWLKALRGGAFIQARGTLVGGSGGMVKGHCCIGVGLAVKQKIGPDKYPNGLTWPQETDTAAASMGLNIAATDRLVEMNDGSMWGFNRIASWIERYL